MEEQENNSHLEDFLEVLQDQHREIKNIGAVLERMSAADKPEQSKINDLHKDIAAIKSAQQEILKSERKANDLDPLTHKINFFLEVATAEMKEYRSERKSDILVMIKSRKLMICSVVSVAIGILGIIMCVRYWNENRRLKESDLKYRYYKMTGVSPQLIDSFYRKDPDGFKVYIEKFEKQEISDEAPGRSPMQPDPDASFRAKKKKNR